MLRRLGDSGRSDRKDKNSCSDGREGQGSLTWIVSCWCERGELNPHGLPRQILSLMRLPFRHSRTHGCACMTEEEWSRCRDLNPGPLGPEPSALPNCATPRPCAHIRHTHSIEHGSTRVKRFRACFPACHYASVILSSLDAAGLPVTEPCDLRDTFSGHPVSVYLGTPKTP